MALEVWDVNALDWSEINAGTTDIANSDIIPDGYMVYVEGIVNTSQKNVNYKVGDGTTQFQSLPWKIPVYIEISSNTNVTSSNLAVNGNCLIFHNTSATARTITLDGSTNFSLAAYATAIWRYNTAWWNEDDSEKGTFTPELTFGGANVGMTYATRTGKYKKQGNIIFYNIYIALSAKGSSIGTALIEDLPFLIGSSTADFSPGSLRISAIPFTAYPQVLAITSSDTLRLEDVTTTGTRANMDDTNFSDLSSVIISGHYFIS